MTCTGEILYGMWTCEVKKTQPVVTTPATTPDDDEVNQNSCEAEKHEFTKLVRIGTINLGQYLTSGQNTEDCTFLKNLFE